MILRQNHQSHGARDFCEGLRGGSVVTLFLRFDVDQLLSRSDQLISSCALVENCIETLQPGMRRLAMGWEGAAADGFQNHVRAWQEAQQRLLDDLRELREALEGAAQNYRTAEDTNVLMWSGE
jgi:WXG100 family type VII secretion target